MQNTKKTYYCPVNYLVKKFTRPESLITPLKKINFFRQIGRTDRLDAQLKEKDTNFNPVNNQKHYEDIEEMVLEGLRKPEYQ